MNKKILVYYSQLNIGGAEKSLVRLMNALSRDGNDVTLLTRYAGGACEHFLDEKVRVCALSTANPKAAGFARFGELCKAALQRRCAQRRLARAKETYDAAIIGLQGLSPEVVCRYVKADCLALCVRSDLSRMRSKEQVAESILAYAGRIDRYLCVSQTAKESLDALLPQVSNRSFVLYNMLDADQMRRQAAAASDPYPDDGFFRIVSVCRVSDVAKGVFRMLDVLAKLVEEGYPVKWYLVGDGPDLPALRERIRTRGLEDRFITVGRKEDPFGYYRYCDLVAVPSYYEGLCGIVNEAKIVGCAVLATEFSGIHEQLRHGENGWIVGNSEEAILQGMRTLLSDRDLLAKIKNDDYPQDIADDSHKLVRLYREFGWLEE